MGLFVFLIIRPDLPQLNMHILECVHTRPKLPTFQELGISSLPVDGREVHWLLAVTPLPCQIGIQKLASTHVGQGEVF